MIGLILGVLASVVGAVDLYRVGRSGTAVAWGLGGLMVTLFVPFGGFAMLVAAFPLRKWVSARQLERAAAAAGPAGSLPADTSAPAPKDQAPPRSEPW